jgi:hemerythrin-like domain-containing protein
MTIQRRDIERFIDQHDETLEQLALMEEWVERLPEETASEQKSTVEHVLGYIEQYIVGHIAWEEEHVLGVIDEGTADVLKREHRYIIACAKLLRAERAPRGFRRRAFKLIGLIEAHFQVEEAVLVPMLKRVASAPDDVDITVSAVAASASEATG